MTAVLVSAHSYITDTAHKDAPNATIFLSSNPKFSKTVVKLNI